MATTIETLLALSIPTPKTETVCIPRLVMPDGQPLTLATGEPVPALADDRVQAIGQSVDDSGQLRPVDRVEHLLLCGIGADELEVGADRFVEDMTVLGDDADGLAQIGE